MPWPTAPDAMSRLCASSSRVPLQPRRVDVLEQVPQVCVGAFASMSEALDALKPWILCMHARQKMEEEEEEEGEQRSQQQETALPPLAPFGHIPPSVVYPPSWLQFAQHCTCIARCAAHSHKRQQNRISMIFLSGTRAVWLSRRPPPPPHRCICCQDRRCP
jgi:hypothetical protein